MSLATDILTKRNEIQIQKIEFLLKTKKDATFETFLDETLKVVKYTAVQVSGNKPTVAIWQNKKKTPIAHYTFPTEERRDVYIQEQIESIGKTLEQKKERKQIKAKIQEGDILYTSWGYDQTNVDFYYVVGLIGKATIEVIKIGSKQVEQTSWGSANVIPDADTILDDTRKRYRINQYGAKIDGHQARVTNPFEKHHSSWYA
jgi:hypothetical protein